MRDDWGCFRDVEGAVPYEVVDVFEMLRVLFPTRLGVL